MTKYIKNISIRPGSSQAPAGEAISWKAQGGPSLPTTSQLDRDMADRQAKDRRLTFEDWDLIIALYTTQRQMENIELTKTGSGT